MENRTIRIQTEIPGPKSRELMEQRRAHVARGPFHSTPVFAKRANGARIEDVDGNQFIDFASGIGVVNVGHTPKRVVDAISAQASELIHGSFNVTPYEGYVALAKKLNSITPGDFPKKTLLVNSGAEAVENAIKIARAHTGRAGVICFEHGFHGRTYMAMSLTSKDKPYKQGFGPFCSDVYRTPFPYAYRWPSGRTDQATVTEECFKKFESLFTLNLAPSEIAAVIIEPVLGEGGFVPAPAPFLRKLRDFCTLHGIVLIADEIQSGFGRTGTLFASEQLGLSPDLITLAKGMGAGMPIAAVTGRAEIMDAPVEGGIGGTYGGNPVACAAALEVIRMFEDENLNLLARSRNIGETLQARLKDWRTRFDMIGETRGLGPMQAIEFVKDRQTKEPFKEGAAAVAKHAYENGVILLTAGTFGNVVRLLIPLVIEPEALNEGLDVIEDALKKLR